MKRIYGFILGLAVLAAPMAAMSALASADPTTKPMDYQQVTDTVVARGLAARGIPFSWAGGGVNGPSRGTGSGANTVGFDASGLMQYAYAGAGIKLPRSSGAIYQVGQKIPPAQAQKGDMLFYGPNGTESVAMFLGNNQMLEVGDVVQVSPVRSSGMTPYVVRVLGTPQASLQQAPTQQLPGQPAPLAPAQQLPGQPAPVQQAPLQQTAGAGASAGAFAGTGTSCTGTGTAGPGDPDSGTTADPAPDVADAAVAGTAGARAAGTGPGAGDQHLPVTVHGLSTTRHLPRYEH